VETPPAETPPAEAPPTDTAPVAAEPVEVKTPRPGSGVAYTTVDMSLRNGPSATEPPVTVVPAGSRVVLTGVMEGGFQRVTYKDQIGWIADEYLQSPADPEPEVGKRGNPQYSRREIIRIINQAADRYGQSRSDMVRVAECESNLDPYAVNPSGSYGLFQFIRSTWKSTPYGNKDIFDPQANANAAAWMWSEGRKSEWVCQ
ncbi:MAG: transglycosylase SLT domain-containing protein, partial [Chloroflexi bacterium]|nr:transglycosylase SLT domain-containing protein [Chloroflexota bacterium]